MIDSITGFLFGYVPWFAWLLPVLPLLFVVDRFVPQPFNKWANIAVVGAAVAMGLYGKGSNDTEERWKRKLAAESARLQTELTAEMTKEALRANRAEERSRQLSADVKKLVDAFDGKGNVPRALIDRLRGLQP